MARYRTWRLQALLFTLVASGGGWAIADSQAPPARKHESSERPGGRPGADRLQDDEEMRAAMEQVMILRLKRALRLSPEQETRVMPRVQRLLDSRRDFAARRRLAVSHLRALLIDETAAAPDIERGLRELKSIDEDFRAQQSDLRREIDRDLAPAQQARMYLFEDQFRRSMQRRLQEARERRRGTSPPRAESDPGPGDEDLEDPGP